MKTFRFLFAIILMPALGTAASLVSYQEEIQKQFLREAAKPATFKKGVQTARLLGLLEFLPPEGFGSFHACMKQEKHWDRLSARQRERILNECRLSGRVISSIEKRQNSGALGSIRPADAKRQQQDINQLRIDISELREIVENLSRDLKNNDDRILERLKGLQNNLTSSVTSQSKQTLESFETF